MPETIGKYQLLGRIGRGGMGTIFKAHDPVLDRGVAVKVISSEVEVTDELRTRFFREAQACARLSHPNIITVYDMGEDDGRLFIVMELLEGEELQRLLNRRALALEDKLSIMVQACSGLYYAHQKGIVHRDIKPGNIMVLSNGQVKVLDFGIALIATAEWGLTQTGLIMGTLRYVSPEQVRGRADHRSDMFSLGAVFYELLGLRPPFNGTDPIQILEQLRAEEPPSLRQLDPSIPPELAAVVERAMRKDPRERFSDLEEMRLQLEQVQRGLTEEAQRVRAHLRGQRDQVRRLEVALAERIGSPQEDQTVPIIDQDGHLAAMQALEADLAARIERAQAKIARADELAPALQHGAELVEAEQFADAIAEFQAVVADIPEHRRALELLAQARTLAEAHRHRQLAAQLVKEARTAFDEGEYALCLAILKQAADGPAPAGALREIASVRQSAEEALAAQAAARQAQQQTEAAREHAIEARGPAQTASVPQHVQERWAAAEAKFTEAGAAIRQKTWARAAGIFNEVEILYGQVEKATREAQERERRRAEEARDRATQSQRGAVASDAEDHAPAVWNEASAKVAEAERALARGQYAKAVEVFDEAWALYRQADQQVQDARRQQREQAEQGRQTMAERRRSAQTANAALHAPSDWAEAEASANSGEAAFTREAYTEASRIFDQGTALYRRSEERARESVRAIEIARANAEKADEATALARQAAAEVRATKYASEQWRAAESTEAQARAALQRREYAAARSLFDEGRRHYAAAMEAADVAGKVEARRADAMIVDAKRLLESGDVTACLRRVNEVLALRSDHTAANLLRVEAEEALRRSDVAAREAATRTPEEAEPGSQTTVMAKASTELIQGPRVGSKSTSELSGVPREVPGVPESTVRADASTVGTGAPTVLAEPPTVVADVETVFAEPARQGGLKPWAQPGGAREEAERGVQSKRRAASNFPGRANSGGGVAREPMIGRRSRWRPAAIGLGTVAIAGVVLSVYWQSSSMTTSRSMPPLSAPNAPAVTSSESPTTERIEGLRKEVIASREAAASAGAERRAEGTFRAALAKERAAAVASEERDWAAARTRYEEALTGYRTAAAKASAAAQRESEIQRLQDQVDSARRIAEVGGAPRLAKTTWTKALVSQRSAETALKLGEFDKAQTLFGESAAAYREAAKQANEQNGADAERRQLAAVRQKLQTAEEAAVAAASARRSAEDANAPRYASVNFAAARKKEEEARMVLARQDYESAELRFREASRDYQAALQEAQRASDAERLALSRQQQSEVQQGASRRAVEEMRTKAQADRAQAVKAGADVVAKDLFAAAAAQERDGDRLAAGQNVAAATQAYQNAADRYAEAGRRAREMQETRAVADQAQVRMAAEKQRAWGGDEFNAALAQERQANQHYYRGAFREASEGYAAATELFAKAAGRRPAAADEVRGALNTYVRAFDTKDVALVQKIQPGLKREEVQQLRETFEQNKEYQLSLRVDSVDVSGNEAVVKGRREDNLVAKNGQSFRKQSNFTFRLKRTGDGWIIDAAN